MSTSLPRKPINRFAVKKIEKSPLTLEEQDALSDIDSTLYRLILKHMEWQVSLLEKAVNEFRYKPGDEQRLCIMKAEAQGAREFLNRYTRTVEKLKS